MKYILAVILILSGVIAVSQQPFPITQTIGSVKNTVAAKGMFTADSGFVIRTRFNDTADNSLATIKQVPGVIINVGDRLFMRDSTATKWVSIGGGGGGVTSIGVINSQTKSANGAVISGTSLVMQTVDATYPGLMTSADKLRLDSTSYLTIDKTYDSLAWGRNDSVFLVKSLRMQVNGGTISPTTTDSTLSYNLTSLATSLTNGLTLSSGVGKWGGALTDAITSITGASYTKSIQFEQLNQISIEANQYQFQAYNGNITDGFAMNGSGSGLQSENTGISYSELRVKYDTILFMPPLGLIKIDTLAAASNMTNKKVMVWDESTGIWQQITKDSIATGGGGGGVTSIGTINSQTKSANGAVITGTSLVMQTVDATYPGLMTSADKLRLDSTSYLSIDKTFDSLAWGRNDSVFLVKSLRVQVNGSTITPTTTDSTLSYNLTSLTTSLTNGLTLSSGVGKLGGALTENTNITNATGYTFKLHLDEDDSDVGLIGDTYNSLIGFQNGNIAIYQNGGATTLSVTSTYASLQAASGGYNTELLVYRDKVQVNPHLGALYIDTLQSAVGTKALRYNPTTGLVSYADTTSGGSPAGNYGNVQLNRNGAFATPASDSLDFDAGLSIKGSLTVSSLTSGRVPFISTSGLITDDAKLTFSAGSYPSLTIGAAGGVESSIGLRDPAGTFGYVTSKNGLSLIGSNTYNGIYLYPSAAYIDRPFVSFYHNTGGPKSASFHKTVIGVDTLVGGLTDGSIQIIGSQGDSTSAATTNNGHAFRAIAKMYGNAASVNTFYSSIYMGNTNSGVTQGHGAAFQSDFFKTGSNTVDIFYHGTFLSDQILSGIVNKRYGIHFWDAHVNTGAQLGMQAFLKINKLDAATSNFDFLSDSASTAKLAGNIFLGDSTASDAGVNNSIHFFNGTAPSANISGAILYAEGGELKGRDAAGNITVITDPAGGSATDLSIGTRTATDLPLNSSTGADVSLPLATSTLAGIMSAADKARLDSNQYFTGGEGIIVTQKNDSTIEVSLKYDTTALASFGAGAGLSTDTAAFQTTSIYGSFYNSGSDTLIVTSMRGVLQGSSPDITYKVFFNDSINVEAGATALVTAGSNLTNTTTGSSVTSFNATKIPPGNWIWVKTSALAAKPTYFSLTIIGYKKRVAP